MLPKCYTCSSWNFHRYEEAKSKGNHNFDRELEDLIERLIVECERKIQRALKRLEDEDAKAAIAISVSEVTQVPASFSLRELIQNYNFNWNSFACCSHLRSWSFQSKLKRSYKKLMLLVITLLLFICSMTVTITEASGITRTEDIIWLSILIYLFSCIMRSSALIL